MLSRPADEANVELMVLTLFGGAALATCHDDEALYGAAAFDRSLPFVFDGRKIAVYDVWTEPARTLSYANLRVAFRCGSWLRDEQDMADGVRLRGWVTSALQPNLSPPPGLSLRLGHDPATERQ